MLETLATSRNACARNSCNLPKSLCSKLLHFALSLCSMLLQLAVSVLVFHPTFAKLVLDFPEIVLDSSSTCPKVCSVLCACLYVFGTVCLLPQSKTLERRLLICLSLYSLTMESRIQKCMALYKDKYGPFINLKNGKPFNIISGQQVFFFMLMLI